MKKLLLVILFHLSLSLAGFGQGRLSLSGHIKDAASGEALLGATVLLLGTNEGAVSNEYGFYSLQVPRGRHSIQVSYMGYKTKQYEIDIDERKRQDFELEPSAVNLETVEVREEVAYRKVREVGMSVERLSMQDIQKMPKLMGEVDIVRNIQLLPGISTVGEGTSGYNVRGGGADENLILLDEAPVYNASHLFGFFSVFNADAIKDAKIYKGGLPAQYGGRLSSVLDVRQLEGNNKTFGVKGGIGNLSSRITVEGPILKEKTSFLVSGRRSYLDLFSRFAPDEGIRNSGIHFFDLNAKVNHKFSDRDKVYLSYYAGNDAMKLDELYKTSWGNHTMTFRWNHVFTPKLFSNFTVFNSHYYYDITGEDGLYSFEWASKIKNRAVKMDAAWFISPERTLDFGFQSNYQIYFPGNVSPTNEESGANQINMESERGLESALYLSLEEKIGDQLKVQAGLRFADFRRLGGRQFIYREGPKTKEAITDTVTFRKGEAMAGYNGLEPRLTISFQPSGSAAIKASYHRANQFVHLISNTAAPSPIDLWKPSNAYIKPARVDQLGAGFFKTFQDDAFELSFEGYYKRYNRLLDFKDGAQLLFNEAVETEVLEGIGRAYGLEISLEKKKGDFTGRISYTLARSERKVEGINHNDWYRANFDKPHDLNAYGIYKLNAKWDFSANFVFSSGRPFTQPVGRYGYNGMTLPVMGERNAHRLPAYHRLDLAANLNPEGKRGSWSFGLYNVYARRNAYSIFFRKTEDSMDTEAVRLSILGTIIPSITYNFKF